MRRESAQLEYKSQVSPSFLKTVSAFANYEGGQVLFGVADDGAVVGLDDPIQAALDIENAINDSIDPSPPYSIHVNQRYGTITLTVKPGSDLPYRCKGKAYCRKDSATVEVDRTELDRLTLRGQGMSFEDLPATRQDLSFETLEEHLGTALGVEHASPDVMRSLGLMDAAGTYNRAAELLADANTCNGIDITRFGSSKNTVCERIACDNVSLLHQYTQALEVFERYYQQEVIEGAARQSVYLVPLLAFREAVVNGMVHRTWDTNARMQIAMYPDRIVVTSPGGLPYGITEDEYLHREISVPRNPIIADVFYRLRYIERFGTGVRRIVRSYTEASVSPVFDITRNAIQVALPVIEDPADQYEEVILSLLKRGGSMSTGDIVLASGLNRSRVSRTLAALLLKGDIDRDGVGRGTTYRLP